VHETDQTSGIATCDFCDMEIRGKTALVQHMNTHLKLKMNKCEFCEESFRSKVEMVKNIIESFKISQKSKFNYFKKI
jgi:predicted nucleic acid-binding protein